MNYDERFLHAVLRQDFSSFIHKCFLTINPGVEFLPNWHIDLIADTLEQIRHGKLNRLIINMPPRSLKSVCVSVAWPAWLLGHNPKCRIIVASYSQILSIKHSLDCKLIIDSSWYKDIFPLTRLSKCHNQKSKFLTTEHGFRFATSIGGSITGEGGDYLIIDDPHNPTHINSKKLRIKVLEWYEQTFSTRLNDKKKGAILLVMQRLHEEDLSGYLLSKSKTWQQLKLPAIANKDTSYKIFDQNFIFRSGQVLHSAREEIIHLNAAQEELGIYNFAAQYLQEPVASHSCLLKREEIIFYESLEEIEYIVQSWDTAIKVSVKADYSVCTTWGIKKNKYFLIHLLRGKYEYTDLKHNILSLAKKFNPKLIIIEDKASGQSIIQDLLVETNLNIKKYKSTLDKITRFAATIPLFEAGRICLPKNAAWLEILLCELMAFPNSKNDDIIDSISQFIEVIKNQKNIEARIRMI